MLRLVVSRWIITLCDSVCLLYSHDEEVLERVITCPSRE
jgi:hypothetical protein